MRPEPAKFTKDRPCTKLHIWTCFYGANGFVDVQVDQAHAVIGLNVPRVLERAGRIVKIPKGDALMYRVTQAGRTWMTDGILAYLKNHPEDSRLVKYYPDGGQPRVRRVRR